jgi:GNAT superfamily N-acetyltransferase
MLSHRPVQDQDISTICQFPQTEIELFFMYPKATYPLTCDQLKAAIDQRSDSTVVMLDKSISGFANFYISEPGEKCCIGNLIIAPDKRGKGVGKYLVETMVQLAYRNYRAMEIHISCFNQNVAGLLLYTRCGFCPFAIDERVDKEGNRVALIHMRLVRNPL